MGILETDNNEKNLNPMAVASVLIVPKSLPVASNLRVPNSLPVASVLRVLIHYR